MEPNTAIGKERFMNNKGYALLAAMIVVIIFSVLLLKARDMWETEIQRDLEEELLFRARQYVVAIDAYQKKNPGQSTPNLKELMDKKFLRRPFKDPMTKEGKWNLVMKGNKTTDGSLLIVPEEMLAQYSTEAMIVGVCSTSKVEGFRSYRKKKKYCEWAVYLGDDPKKSMPKLKFVAVDDEESGDDSKEKDDSGDSEREKEIEEDTGDNGIQNTGTENKGRSEEDEENTGEEEPGNG